MWPPPDRLRCLVVTLGQSFICTAYPVAVCTPNTLGGSMELHVCSGTKALRGAPARPCSSGHRTEEKPTPFCAIGSPCPEQSAMACRPWIHPSHASVRDTQLLTEGQLRILITVQCYTNGHPHSQRRYSCIWCSVNRLCLSNETLCPIMPPSDANPRNKSPRQPAAPEGLHDRSLLRLGPFYLLNKPRPHHHNRSQVHHVPPCTTS